ncbi:MAG: hypothetical protein AAGF46_02965 [Pseudomonadota bacterium]
MTTAASLADSPRHWLVAVVFLPLIAVNLNYLISATHGYIPVCVPYLEGCTSISATGRSGISYWLFKIMMLPHAIVLTLFWRSLDRWLANSEAARHLASGRVVLMAGLLGAAFLVLYTVFLGSSGEIYRLMRRYGVFVFFLGTLIAQIAATRRLGRLSDPAWQRTLVMQRVTLTIMGILAIAEVPLGKFGLADSQAENFIEWNFSLAMQCWFASWWLGPGRRS